MTWGYQRRLALYHYCLAWHSGQGSREYAVLSRMKGPARTDEFSSALVREGNEGARALYIRLASANLDRHAAKNAAPRGLTSGYSTCVCCGHAFMVDDVGAESGVTMCDDCVAHSCDPDGPCECECEDENEDEGA